MDSANGMHAFLAKACICVYMGGMCKPFRDYMNLVREYTRELITFVGLGLMCYVYSDFKEMAEAQSSTSAHTVEVLRSMDARLQQLERQNNYLPAATPYEK
jgi:hypothetical protein